MEIAATVTQVAVGCGFVYITARLVFMAYFSARATYIKNILDMSKEK